ncbi:MAG: NAD(P)-dependent oxidoreductase [Candidatus Promineifilaceae bacterium]|nr:NAD(P)-dependent oxidoreductase [Candidatus Promineifilaceae bacterium]
MSVADRPLQGKRVLITGVTGFIGRHLARRLAEAQNAVTFGLSRHPERAAHLRTAGVTLLPVDITDRFAMRQAVSDQEIIFHLVKPVGATARDADLSYQVNVIAVERLVQAATEAGVRRLVLVSSIAAYGPPDQKVMSESHPLAVDQSAVYGRTKAQGELLARQRAEDLGLEMVVLRPGQVYGPGSPTWTLNLARLVQRGLPVILGQGKGHAHPVYVGNLVDGLILAATVPAAAGESFNMVDGPVPWRLLFEHYGRIVSRPPRRAPLWLARLILLLFLRISGRTEPPAALLSFLTNRTLYPMIKAEQILGHRPQVDLDEGMRRSADWLRAAGHLDG